MVDLKRMRALINRLPRELWMSEKALASATKMTSMITGMPRGGSSGNLQEERYIAYAEARDAYREVLQELSDMRNELEPMIDLLEDPDEKAAMRLRYLDGLRPAQIADRIFRTERCVFSYLKKAERHVIAMQK